ncbi:MAG TPA: type I secretion system permease/ATPase [Devosia sp.]|jgi:ATP-binding cassette subfamily C protein LapB|nr:type I secretion system permease/ATPase [Devosia sp.]
MKMWGNAREAGAGTAPASRQKLDSAQVAALAKASLPGAMPIAPMLAPAAAEAPEMPPRADPILAIVRYLARRWGRPESPDVIVAGLPLADGLLTVKLLPRALERVGLRVQPKKTPLKALADFDLPAIVANREGGLLLIVERSGRNRLLCFDPVKNAEIEIQSNSRDWRYRHQLLLIKQEDETARIDDADAPLAQRDWLRAALKGHGRSITLVLLAAAFINVFALAMPLFSMNVYDRVLPNGAVSTLWVLSIGIASVFLFDFLLKVARGAIIDYAGRGIDLRLSTSLFDRVVNTNLSARPTSTGAFINRITQYETLRDFFTSQTVAMFVDILFMGVFLAAMFYLLGWVTIFPVIAVIVALVSTYVIGVRSTRAIKASLTEQAQRNSILVETLTSPQTVKASRSEGRFLRNWENSILASSETQSKIKYYQQMASQTTATVSQLASIGILIGGTYSFADHQITTGAIIAAMMLSSRVIAPVAQISAAMLRTRSAIEAYRSIAAIMKLPDERTVRKSFVSREIDKGRIELRKVRFRYPGAEHFVLDQVSFGIKPGEKVGIIGRIGSGKTTLGRLLVNFYEASEGEVFIDGVSIKQYHPAELRRQVGLVLQDPELFNGTVKDNIMMSDPSASDQRLLDVARRAGVEEFVARHPAGFDMPVGERGHLLSGGQRQAVALARTLLVNPRVLFLDEPSSSMDLATERQLIGHLSQSLEDDHTVLIATHRFSLLKLVTRIIVLDNGRVAADGERDAVLAQLKVSIGDQA